MSAHRLTTKGRSGKGLCAAGVTGLTLAAAFATAPQPAHALIAVFSGVDINPACAGGASAGCPGGDNAPRIPFPNSQNASNSFQNALIGVGTETFEPSPSIPNAPAGGSVGVDTLNISFPTTPTPITATLSGGGGKRIFDTPGTSTDGNGRYPISNSQFLQLPAVVSGSSNPFQINFNAPVAAFGFFGVDIGDFGGNLQLQFFNGSTALETYQVPTPTGRGGSTSGSVLFWGAITNDPLLQFTRVVFTSRQPSGGTTDNFAFDNFTVGSIQQVDIPAPPATAGALLLLGAISRLRRRYAPRLSQHRPE